MVIDFFTNSGALNKISSSISFNGKDLGVINSFINISIVLSFAAALFILIFIYKVGKIIITSRSGLIKSNIIDAVKEFGKLIVIMLVFVVVFQLIFLLFDVFERVFDKAYNSIENSNNGTIEKIPHIMYELITNGSTPEKDQNFLFPSCFLDKANSMNFIVSILYVLTFSGFLVWIVWSIFQKMIEIFFLYLSFPISIAFGQESQRINWKIWTKEIINKIALIFMMMLFLRLFLYLFYFIYSSLILNDARWSKTWNLKLYISFFTILALGSAMIFMTRLLSINLKENIGIISSFKQTKSFIENNKQIKNFNSISKINEISLEPINSNINSIKNDISRFNYVYQIDLSSLEKVKVFNK